MAISLIEASALALPNGGNVNNTITAAKTGDVIILFGGFNSISPAVSAGPITAGYTQVVLLDDHLGSGNEFGVWYKVVGAVPDTEVLAAGSSITTDTAVYGFYQLRGVSNTTVIDATATTAGPTGSTNPDPPAITTSTSNAWVITVAGSCISDASTTEPSGYVNKNGNSGADTRPYSAWGATKLIATPASEDPGTWTNWVSGTWYAITIAVRESQSNFLPLLGVG